ncbi:MAG: hypothetical protein ACR2NR_14870 [Solirubrobacteraceae bacterium]
MHVWLELILRELLFLVLLTLLGLAPATWLPARFGRGVRVALAPAFGLAVGVCLTVTTEYAFAARETDWLVVVVALASGGVGLAGLGLRPLPSARTVLQLALVVLVVIASFDYPLAARHSVGPIGGYQIADTSGYVSEIASEQRYSIHQMDRIHAPAADLAVLASSEYVQAHQQLDVSPLEANVDSLLGLGPTDTQTAFLIAIILTGALGAFGVVRSVAGESTWAAPFAGCLFAGPLFAELLMDGSQAALAGAALLAPLVAVGVEAIRARRWRTLGLFALLAAGLQTIYPLFVPAAAIAGAVTIAVAAVARRRRGRVGGRMVAVAAVQLGGVLALTVALTPVAFLRNVSYWLSVLNGSFSFAGLPAYNLPANVLPGWIVQTREFYGLIPLSTATTGELVGSALVPLLLIAVIAMGAFRHRAVLVMLAVAAGAIALAEYTWAGQSCSYCVQRNLLPAALLVPSVLGIGLGALGALRWRGGRISAALVGLLALILIGHQGIVERQRLEQGAYVLDPQLRQAGARIPARSGPVELEGFSESTGHAQMELPEAYDLVDRVTHGAVSLPTITDDGAGLQYLGGTQPLGPSFRSNYQYVLTRLGSVVTGRTVIARFGPIVLQRRTAELDVTLIGGVSVADARTDRTGAAWVSGPLTFLVVGGHGRQPAWISLVLSHTVPAQVLPGSAVASSRNSDGLLRVCLRAAGTPPVRAAAVQVGFAPVPQPPPSPYAPAPPAHGLRLLSMSVSTSSCARVR